MEKTHVCAISICVDPNHNIVAMASSVNGLLIGTFDATTEAKNSDDYPQSCRFTGVMRAGDHDSLVQFAANWLDMILLKAEIAGCQKYEAVFSSRDEIRLKNASNFWVEVTIKSKQAPKCDFTHRNVLPIKGISGNYDKFPSDEATSIVPSLSRELLSS